MPDLNHWLIEQVKAEVDLREIFISCLWPLLLANPELVILFFFFPNQALTFNKEIHFTEETQYIKKSSLRSVLQFSFPSPASPYTIPLVFAFPPEVSPSFLIPNSSSVFTKV